MANFLTRKNHQWTDYERDIIRAEYKHTRVSRRALAEKLGVTDYGVAGQISNMGLGKTTDRRPWTPAEDEKLAKLIPRYGVGRIASEMHRSINSVTLRAKRLGLKRRDHVDWFTKRDVCEIIGHDHRWVQARIDSGALPATYHHDHRPQKDGSGSWHIEKKDLVHFIRRYPSELVGYNIDIVTIVELLAGIEAP